MTDPFDQPSPPGAGIDFASLKDCLLLISVHGQEIGLTTKFSKQPGDTSAVRADVDVIDGKARGEQYRDTLIFPKVLQGQLRGHVGGKVIGRLTLGEAKNGQSAPWLLADASAADLQLGRQFLAGQVSSASAAPPF